MLKADGSHGNDKYSNQLDISKDLITIVNPQAIYLPNSSLYTSSLVLKSQVQSQKQLVVARINTGPVITCQSEYSDIDGHTIGSRVSFPRHETRVLWCS